MATQQNYTPDQELERLKTDTSFSGGTSYGRTPGGIVDLKTGSIVSGSNDSGTSAPMTTPVRRYDTAYTAPTTGTYASEAAKIYGQNVNQPVQDEATIRAKLRENVQSQIDTIKAVAADRLAAENIAGKNRSGQTRAINARSGVIGQDFGNAAQDKTTQANSATVKAIENERDMMIQSILTKVDSEAYTRAKDATETARKNADQYVGFLKEKRDAARTDIATLAKSGMTLDKLTDQQYKNLLDSSEMTPAELNAAFVLNKPQKSVVTSFTEGNKYYVITKDPITGKNKTETIDLGFSVPKNYNQQKVNDNTILFFPDKFDESKPIKDQIITYSVGGGKAGNTTTGTYVKGADVVVDSWAERIANGNAKITDIPATQATLRNKVAVALQSQGNATSGKPVTTEIGKQTLKTAQSLLTKFDNGQGTITVGKSRILGGGVYGAMFSGTDSANFNNDFKTLKSQLSLDAAKYLKGSGAISDAERAMLAQAVTKLDQSQSEKEFRTTLSEIITRLEGNSQNISVEEQELVNQGYSPEEIAQIKAAK